MPSWTRRGYSGVASKISGGQLQCMTGQSKSSRSWLAGMDKTHRCRISANMLGTRAEVTAELGYIDRARADGRRALAILERVMTSGRDYLVSIEKEHKSLQIRLAGLL